MHKEQVEITCRSQSRPIAMSARTRLFKEMKEVGKTKDDTGIELIPDDMNIFLWRALIQVTLRLPAAAPLPPPLQTRSSPLVSCPPPPQLLLSAGSSGHPLRGRCV